MTVPRVEAVDIDAQAARREIGVSARTGLGYGLGMVGERMFRDAPALLLLVFMTNYLGIPAAWAGVRTSARARRDAASRS